MVQSFHYSRVFVALADVDGRLAQFYRQVLHCEPTFSIPQVYSEFELPGLRLGIFQPKASQQPEFAAASSGSMSLCIEVENLQEAIAHLTHLGHPPPGAIMHTSHGDEIYAYDPAGNRLILHQSKG
ncbi:VOC family protein [Oscillatoria sp. FACHB-1407]|uniref:VOC family protein n=1 Tax=Oscillatoria sp. FACHB-1407 TaxID=2692847 RepID=UPI001684839F|nr:VOC family protein [Oscillatoria sp. FACHB-1407]MBD2463865.1 VOC family protein [Oscillatoria sp. FACHB-1407]